MIVSKYSVSKREYSYEECLYSLNPMWANAVHSTPGKGSDTRMFSTMSVIRYHFGKKHTKAFIFSPHTWPGSLIIGTISISKYMKRSFRTLWNVTYDPNTPAENIITDCDTTIYSRVERSDKLGVLFSVSLIMTMQVSFLILKVDLYYNIWVEFNFFHLQLGFNKVFVFSWWFV